MWILTLISNILVFAFCFFIFAFIFFILYSLVIFARVIANNVKKHIIWNNLKLIQKIILSTPYKKYSRQAAPTGFSVSYRCIAEHYSYKTICTGTYRKAIVIFKNSKSLKVELKETSILYKTVLRYS